MPGVGTLKATMINAGISTIFANAESIGYAGTELQDAINGDPKALAMFETICAYGALGMGLIKDVDGAAKRQHTPKVAFVAKPVDYTVFSDESGRCRRRPAGARALQGQAVPRPMGTAAVAIGTAAAIPGTLVNLAAGGGERIRPARCASAPKRSRSTAKVVRKAIMSRSALEGWVRVPGDAF